MQHHIADGVTFPLACDMIPKKPAPDLIRGGYRFSEKDLAPPKG